MVETDAIFYSVNEEFQKIEQRSDALFLWQKLHTMLHQILKDMGGQLRVNVMMVATFEFISFSKVQICQSNIAVFI